MQLNISTAMYPENRSGGLMICGLNWGGSPTGPVRREQPSFFSDKTVNDWPYRNRLLRWFEALGHPLIGVKGEEGPFERSIVQTNWLSGQAPHMRGQDLVALCSNHAEDFLRHVEALAPRLILFAGNALFRALNAPQVRSQAERFLGPASAPQFLKKEIVLSGKRLKAFSIGLQVFAKADVIGLPHPTGSRGLSDDYIAAFRDELGPVIARFRETLALQTSSS